MRIVFKINSLDEERERIDQTKKKASWFKEKGYIFVLPIDSLEAEYKLEEYQKRFSQIEREWSKIEQEFFKKTEKILDHKIKEPIEVYLTRYGVGGSYFLPNKIIVNISDEYRNFFNYKNLAHEIIHLFIEPLIQKYKIEHWQKERIVDLITSKILSDYNMQKTPVETKSVDKSFNKFFPDVEEIIKNIK